MADGTHIQWTDATWNPIVGCTHVSPGCDHCYAARLVSGRLAHQPLYTGLADGGKFTGEVRLVPERLGQPLQWRKPRMVFVNSMSDLFHDSVPDGYIARVFAVAGLAEQHIFQVLTKRHGRMRSLLNSPAFRIAVLDATHLMVNGEVSGITVASRAAVNYRARRDSALAGAVDSALLWPPPNVWLGVSVEDQYWADIRIPVLLDTPAVVRWVSVEPLLGPVDLSRWLGPVDWPPCWEKHSPGTECAECIQPEWIVIGGESGPGARPMDPDWAQSIVWQCKDAGVPVFVKQMGTGGAWGPRDHHGIDWFPVGLRVREYPAGAA